MARCLQPTVQGLEGRQLLAAVTFNPTNGVMVVNMDEVPNQRLTMSQSGRYVTIKGSVRGIENGIGQAFTRVLASRVVEIQVKTSAYRDYVDLGGLRARAYSALTNTDVSAGGGNDRIIGSFTYDRIHGGLGNDFISARGGNDDVYGGAGRNDLDGGAGDDTLWGDPQSNNLYDGKSGEDLVRGYDSRRSRGLLNVERTQAT